MAETGSKLPGRSPAAPGRARACRSIFTGLVAMLLGLTAPAGQVGSEDTPVTLLADSITYDAETETITATGSVEVLYEGRVLRARSIVYDAAAGEIRADGPLSIADPDSGTFLAEEAIFTEDLEAGLIAGARLLIDSRLQMASTSIRRSGGRYTTLNRTTASSCTICAENPTPTWALRASRVVQDDVARRIYFENATFEAFGLPIAYIPRMSIPDPRERRASGLLLPEYQSSDIYGVGIKVPYYFVLGPYSDATVTPFLTTRGSVLFEGEYRRRFASGEVDFFGVLAVDDGLGDDSGRGALSGVGEFSLRDGFVSDFELNITSDRTFLQQFDYSDADRLTSFARLQRTRTVDYFGLETRAFQSLREDEDNATVPFILPDFVYRRGLDLGPAGGRLNLAADTLGVVREEGRDMLRAGARGGWTASWRLPRGLLASASAGGALEFYSVRDDPSQPEGLRLRTTPAAQVELRWPFLRNAGRALHTVEPIAQVIYSENFGYTDNPNEDSQLPEFDETNLFAFNRYPGLDRIESGLRANLGLTYQRWDPAGWTLGVTAGRVLRADAEDEFAEGTGLAGRWSDYVGSLSAEFDGGLSLANRALFDDSLTFRRNEFAMLYDTERTDLAAAYIFFAEDNTNQILGPQPETNEFSVDASYRVRPNWEVSGLWRYNATTRENLRAGAGLRYGNECIELDLSVTRRFTSSEDVPPSTSVGFKVRLAALGDNEDWDWPGRACVARGT